MKIIFGLIESLRPEQQRESTAPSDLYSVEDTRLKTNMGQLTNLHSYSVEGLS